MGNGLENLLAEPLAEFHDPLLVTGRTEMSAFASKGQEIFVSAILAPDPGESVMEDATVEIAIDDLLYIRAEKAILPGKEVVINLLKSLKMVLNPMIIL